MKSYVLKRDDGQYFMSQFRGNVTGTDDIYAATSFRTPGGAKSARGWIAGSEKERWNVQPIITKITEVNNP
jgi:hypothetical protein